MTIKDIIAIIKAVIRGKWSVDVGFPDSTSMNGRITWGAFDTIDRQVIGIKPFSTAWFFLFDVS